LLQNGKITLRTSVKPIVRNRLEKVRV